MHSTSTPTPFSDKAGQMAEHAVQGADRAIRSTHGAANHALDRLSDAVHHVPAALHDSVARAEELARRSAAVVHDQALAATAHTRSAIQHDPLKSVVIAAALGAGLAGLWMWLSRRHPVH
ncbi:MAG TPA: hypothetical protein VM845_07635 [Burkholderiaceae bacterium]|jgi:ElaB/YqjD/DUF883 family membrane-anchored ribosome-binding protein|nr:hypothetical protein [Burkholderiaceae bacterium]